MSETDYIQTLVAEAGRLATQAAMNGNPSRVGWIPPATGSDKPTGYFVVVPYRVHTASEGEPWSTKGL
jgi:hypothetical protein